MGKQGLAGTVAALWRMAFASARALAFIVAAFVGALVYALCRILGVIARPLARFASMVIFLYAASRLFVSVMNAFVRGGDAPVTAAVAGVQMLCILVYGLVITAKTATLPYRLFVSGLAALGTSAIFGAIK